jgi:hypothetical protein
MNNKIYDEIFKENTEYRELRIPGDLDLSLEHR